MEDKKAQMGIGTIIIVAIMIIVGAIFVQIIAQSVGDSTNTVAVANDSLGVADNDTTVYLTSYRSISDAVIINESGVIIPSTNYTVTNNVIDPTTGSLAISVLPVSASTAGYTGWTWNISGTAQPVTYIAEGGGRAMAALIVIMFALAVAVIALEPTLRSGVLNMMGK